MSEVKYQEIQVAVAVTMQVSASLTKEEIEKCIRDTFQENISDTTYTGGHGKDRELIPVKVDMIEVVEEADIYLDCKMLSIEKQDRRAIYIGWAVEDVLHRAAELKIACTDEEAAEILQQLKVRHDPCIGITWDVIGEYINALDQIRKTF